MSPCSRPRAAQPDSSKNLECEIKTPVRLPPHPVECSINSHESLQTEAQEQVAWEEALGDCER